MQLTEATRLTELEQIIEQGVQTFVAVGRALEEIREGKLYREQGFETFEDYCRERWGLARRSAYERIEAARVIDNVRSSAQNAPSFTQARELAALEPDEQR